jgi:hypothetical protein
MLRTVPGCLASKGVVDTFSEENEFGEEDGMIRRCGTPLGNVVYNMKGLIIE